MNAVRAADPGGRRAIAGLVLAAGESSRMGRDKALLPYRGRTFLETIIGKLREAGIDRLAVVLGHHAEIIRAAAGLDSAAAGVEIVVNRDYRLGQTTSLQAGLGVFQKASAGSRSPHPDDPAAVILCLVDHPAFDPATLTSLLATFERTAAPVVIPTHGGRRGHPVLIARALFAELLALRPDQGANVVIHAWRDRTELVEVADPGVLVDVDDQAAYQSLEAETPP
jgi:molybdenum cofactor cytidylyltransferase